MMDNMGSIAPRGYAVIAAVFALLAVVAACAPQTPPPRQHQSSHGSATVRPFYTYGLNGGGG